MSCVEDVLGCERGPGQVGRWGVGATLDDDVNNCKIV